MGMPRRKSFYSSLYRVTCLLAYFLIQFIFLLPSDGLRAQELFDENNKRTVTVFNTLSTSVIGASDVRNDDIMVNRFNNNLIEELRQELESDDWDVYKSDDRTLTQVVLESRLSVSGYTLIWSGKLSSKHKIFDDIPSFAVGKEGKLSLPTVAMISTELAKVLVREFGGVKVTQLEIQCGEPTDGGNLTLREKQVDFFAEKIALHLTSTLNDDLNFNLNLFPEECSHVENKEILSFTISVRRDENDIVSFSPVIQNSSKNIALPSLDFDLHMWRDENGDSEINETSQVLEDALEEIGVFYGSLLRAGSNEEQRGDELTVALSKSGAGLEDPDVRLKVARHAMDLRLLNLARLVILKPVASVAGKVNSSREASYRLERARYFFFNADFSLSQNELRYLLRWPEAPMEAYLMEATIAYDRATGNPNAKKDYEQTKNGYLDVIQAGEIGLSKVETESAASWSLRSTLIRAYSDLVWQSYKSGKSFEKKNLDRVNQLLENMLDQNENAKATAEASELNTTLILRLQTISKDREYATENGTLIEAMKESIDDLLSNVLDTESKLVQFARLRYGDATNNPSKLGQLSEAEDAFRRAVAAAETDPLKRKHPTLEFELAEVLYLQKDFKSAYEMASRGLEYLGSDIGKKNYTSENWEVLVYFYKAMADADELDPETNLDRFRESIKTYNDVPYVVRLDTHNGLNWDFGTMTLFTCSEFDQANKDLAVKLHSLLFDQIGRSKYYGNEVVYCTT